MKTLKNTLAIILLAVLVVSCIKLNVQETPVDQTVFVYSAEGKPLEGKKVSLTGNGLHPPSGIVLLTDAQGKANFKFGWEESHESGVNHWHIDAAAENNFIPVNRVRDKYQFNSKKSNPDTVVMDSLVPFKLRFKTKMRVHEFKYELLFEDMSGGNVFFKSSNIVVTPQVLDTIITVRAFKQSQFGVIGTVWFSDKATALEPNPRGGLSVEVPKNFSRDSVFLVYNGLNF